jgi:hypothetical protein
MKTIKRILWIAPLCLALLCGSAWAQLRIVGSITGTVTDPSGAPVPGAKVTLTDRVNGTTKESTTGAEGHFSFPDLANGQFEIAVTATGFQSAVAKNVQVSTSQATDVPIRLSVGQQTESITVEGAAPVLETTTELVTTTQTNKTVNELPVLGRSNALALARLVPGASPPNGGSTRYNNLPGGAVNVTVDGINDASNGFKSGGTVFYMTVPVRLAAVDEISVETGGLGADSGAQSGANIKFVTRRGGNQYHGAGFYELLSEQLNANSWSRNAQGLGRTYSRDHNFGGNIGGRLVPFGYFKDKLFFFGNYEYRFNPQAGQASMTVLTPEAQQGIYTYLVNGTTNQLNKVNVLSIAAANGAPAKIDPVVQSILGVNNQVPKYATLVPSTDFNRQTYIWGQENNLYQYFPTTRFDYYVTPTEQLTFSWNYYHSWQVGARRLPVPDVNRTNPFRLGYFVWNVALQSTLTSHTLNEFRYGVQHSGDSNASSSSAYGPYFTYNNQPLRIGGSLPFGPLVPYIDQQNTTGRHFITTAYDTLTLIRRQHTITVGGSFRRTDWKDTGEVFPIPTYNLGTPSGDQLPGSLFTAANLPGIVSTNIGNNSEAASLYNTLTGRIAQSNFTRVVNPDTYKYDGFINYTWTRSLMGGAYVQDSWRATRNLTLNYGVRWEVQGNMFDVKSLTAIPDYASLLGPSTGLFSPGKLSGNNDPTVAVGRDAYNPDYKNFAPNFGFAWRPKKDDGILGKLLGGDKTVFRGYAGITYYDEGTQMFAGNLGPNAGKTIGANLIAGQGVLPSFYTLSDAVANPVTPAAFTFANGTTYQTTIHQADQTFARNINGMNPNLRAPYTDNWSFGVQRSLTRSSVLEVRYVGNQSHRSWRTSNLNEINIFENGFLQEFKNAQANLTINQANGKGATFANNGLPGQAGLPIFDAAFGPRGTVPAIAAGSGYGNATFISQLQNGEAGGLANTLATNQNYVCRMFGNSFSPCLRVPPAANQAYGAPGAYPINFFMLNPYVSGRMTMVDDSGWNDYNGLQVQFRQRFSRGFTWTANYTWSHAMSNLARDTAQQDLDWTTLRNQSLDRRPSSFDIRHTVQMFGTYDLPIGKDKRLDIRNKLLDSIVGGWTLGSIVVFNTGLPVQLTGGGFQTVNTSSNPSSSAGVFLAPGVTLAQIQDAFQADRQRLTGRAGTTDLQRLAVDSALVGADGRANPNYLVVNRTPGTFAPALFIRDKNTFSWNASMVKNFKISERMKFQLYAGANNVLNHPSWGLANTNIFSTTFGVTGAPSGNRSMNLRGTLSF